MPTFADLVSTVVTTTIDISTATTLTLTPSQYQSTLIFLTGTLTANVTVNFPATIKSWIVVNNATLGSFSVTLGMTGGAHSFLIPAATGELIYSDGTTGLFTASGGGGGGSGNVNITGGTISGISPPIPIASGGTGAATASAALSNLGGVGSVSPTFSNSITLSNTASNALLALNANAGQLRAILTETAGVNRWEWGTDNSSESGSNAGSNFFLSRFNDAGTLIDNPLSIVRSTGVATFSQRPVFGTAVPWDSANLPTPSGSGRLLAIRVFTSSTTYTPTAGTNSVLFRVQAGGGGGGGSAASGNQGNVCGGGAAQAGDYAEHYMTSGFSGLTLTIGAGGTAGTPTANGGPGGDTSVGTVCVCKGGLAGFTLTAASSSHFAAGLTGTRTAGTPGNTLNISGQVPGFSWGISNAMSWSSTGGNSPLGTGGQWSHNDAGTGVISSPGPANPGRGFGAGAGGVDLIGVVSTINGAAGAPGAIIAYEYA